MKECHSWGHSYMASHRTCRDCRGRSGQSTPAHSGPRRTPSRTRWRSPRGGRWCQGWPPGRTRTPLSSGSTPPSTSSSRSRTPWPWSCWEGPPQVPRLQQGCHIPGPGRWGTCRPLTGTPGREGFLDSIFFVFDKVFKGVKCPKRLKGWKLPKSPRVKGLSKNTAKWNMSCAVCLCNF